MHKAYSVDQSVWLLWRGQRSNTKNQKNSLIWDLWNQNLTFEHQLQPLQLKQNSFQMLPCQARVMLVQIKQTPLPSWLRHQNQK